MKPLVSVIVPVYKVEAYLPQCVESIIGQTYQNLEIILVDDGSPDACGSICDDYAKKDNRIKVFHKHNGGLSDARNYGIAQSTGEYLGFVDSDDWIELDMFEVLVNVAEANKADIVACGFYHEYPKRTVVDARVEKKYDNTIHQVSALIKDDIDAFIWNKLYRKTCFSDIAFPYGRFFEDIFTAHKLFLKATSCIYVSKPFYHYIKRRKNSITETFSMDNLIDFWQAHKTRYDFFLHDERFNTDEELMNKLQYWCAIAIARTWRCCFANTAQERKEYASFFEELQGFTFSHFPCFGEKGWPLFLRFSIFLARFNNEFVFALLYYMNLGYRRVRG